MMRRLPFGSNPQPLIIRIGSLATAVAEPIVPLAIWHASILRPEGPTALMRRLLCSLDCSARPAAWP